MKSTIVGFIGGPCCGKTVAALKTTARLKELNQSAEMAREYVKHWAYEKRTIRAVDELFVAGQQVREESLLLGRVKFIVSDRPVLVSVPFVDLYAPEPIRWAVRAAVGGYYKHLRAEGHRCVFILLKRGAGYDQHGRWESRKRAELIDALIEQALGEFGCEVVRATTSTAVRTALAICFDRSRLALMRRVRAHK